MTLTLPLAPSQAATAPLAPDEIAALQAEVRALAAERGAVILAHNYQVPEVQDVADYVGDSLGLSRKAAAAEGEAIVFCGVHFMAETASILCPEKTVLIPDLDAGCSLAASIDAEQLAAEIAHRIHRGLQEFARVEFAFDLRSNFPERRGHRQPAIGIDIDLADTMPDAAHDFLDRHAPGLRHLAAELIERILQRLRHRG